MRSTASRSGGRGTSRWPTRRGRFRDLDEWLRRRQIRWREWKRYPTRRNLRALGMPKRAAREWAGSQQGAWRIAGSHVLQRALSNAYWTDLGLPGFTEPYRRLRDATPTAGCGPACPVVWEAPGEPGAYAIFGLWVRRRVGRSLGRSAANGARSRRPARAHVHARYRSAISGKPHRNGGLRRLRSGWSAPVRQQRNLHAQSLQASSACVPR
jgi:hypothetical protein